MRVIVAAWIIDQASESSITGRESPRRRQDEDEGERVVVVAAAVFGDYIEEHDVEFVYERHDIKIF